MEERLHRVNSLFCDDSRVVEEAVLQGEEGRRRPCGDTALVVDMLDVVASGLLSDAELLAYLACREATRDQS